MYRVSRVNVKSERGSTFRFTRNLQSYIPSILFAYVKLRCSENPPLGEESFAIYGKIFVHEHSSKNRLSFAVCEEMRYHG